MSDEPKPSKYCASCKQWKPLTPEFFYWRSDTQRFRDKCIECRNLERRTSYIPKPKATAPPDGMKYCTRRERCCNPHGDLLPATDEFFYVDRKTGRLFSQCKACVNKGNSERSKSNPHWAKEANCRYKERRPERITQSKIRYRSKPTTQLKEQEYRDWYRTERGDIQRDAVRKWSAKNRDYRRIQSSNRRALKRNLPDTLTVQEWRRATEYFDNLCVYCGSQQGLWNSMTADHFIPLDSPNCLGTIAGNIVPACSTCNSSKRNADPAEWLNRKFGKRRAREILKRIETYFQWVQEQDGGK